MRRSPVTIGVIAAELALGALVLAPPAAADEPAPADPSPPVPAVDPEPNPQPAPKPAPLPAVTVRSGRTGDPHAVTPIAGAPNVPAGDGPVEEPQEAPAAPKPDPTPKPKPKPTPSPKPGPKPEPTPAHAPLPSPSSPTPTLTPDLPTSPAPSTAAPAPAASAPPAHTVSEGDSLWHIAAAHVAAVSGRDRAVLPVADVAAYWVRVCDANRATLRSGDLDLIYPGEVVTLPPLL